MRITKGLNNDIFVMGPPSDADFDIIKGLTASNDIKPEDLFTYKVILCDNMVDRDHERFSHKALENVVDLFKGVVGIEDHNATVKNNHSRIYKTELVVDESRHNEFNECYECAVGYAYTLNNAKNKDLIDEIRSGLKKEVSIGFDTSSKVCSVCGSPLYSCDHVIGHEYDCENGNRLCVGIIDSVDDAYEWSFVSIPAQKRAGVIKKFNIKKEEKGMDIKELSLEIAPKLDSDLAVKFMSAIDELMKPESEIVKSLKSKINTLEGQVAERDSTIKAMKEAEDGRLVSEAIHDIFEELKPKNDVLRDLAYKEIKDLIKVEDGAVVGVDEAKAKLSSEAYAPMFGAVTDETAEDVEDDDSKKYGDDVGIDKSFIARASGNKHIDFTRVSKFKCSDKKFSNKSVGIRNDN